MINDYQLLAILRLDWAGEPLNARQAQAIWDNPGRCAELETLYRWDDHK